MEFYKFIGEPCCDFILYLAALSTQINRKVAVLDYTNNRRIINMLSEEIQSSNMIHFKGYDVTSNLEYDPGCQYDHIFVVYDFTTDSLLESQFRFPWKGIYVISDVHKRNLLLAVEILCSDEAKGRLILRDTGLGKISYEYISTNYLPSGEKCIVIEYDEEDYIRRVELEFEVNQRKVCLSKSYKDALIKIAEEITGEPMTKMKKAFQQLERGK
ncbi:hypothetical protein [Anaeromicropila populeti]|uniref:Uncharacterized protein n=1 Tax=Anaeromicropila populeti TaxID=37658 RepID=A0A1I6JD82_9FIRM|nr:hypothetical protein [Anaeromicropila populeti]SFR76907.1 hypothetical protein SAMN05661086_01582 [Anaeromicropila populeti]